MKEFDMIVEYVGVRHPEVHQFTNVYTRISPPLKNAKNIRIYVCNGSLGRGDDPATFEEYWCYAPPNLFKNFDRYLEALRNEVRGPNICL